jgi:hypothetical protein
VDAALVTFGDFASYLLLICGRDAVDMKVVEELITEGAEEYKELHGDRWGNVFYALLDLSRYQFCAASDCGRSYASEEGKFKICSGCGYTPYCSRKCQ